MISYVQEERMVVVLPNAHSLIELKNSEDVGIQLFFDDLSYKAMFAALREVLNAKENRLA